MPGLLHAYGDDIEADFHEYYRLDIADVYTGALSPAKAFRLMLRLPAASRFIRAVAGPKAEWNASEYILAGILDTLANANWQRGGGKGRRPSLYHDRVRKWSKPATAPSRRDRMPKY
nr:hypothetical protein GCM10025732_48330 [Glycomyces mayteni]